VCAGIDILLFWGEAMGFVMVFWRYHLEEVGNVSWSVGSASAWSRESRAPILQE
jgi:hypothetical protein